jgi:hypothetical protein
VLRTEPRPSLASLAASRPFGLLSLAQRILYSTLIIMSKLIDDAVKVLRELPDDIQAAAARAIIEYSAGYDDDDLALSDDQVTVT